MTSYYSLLVIDDELPFLELVRDYFKARDFKVWAASTSEEAMKLMKHGRFDVVILDYQMPHIRGDDLIGKLQHLNPGARFIIVTGLNPEEIESRFTGLGYYAFVPKGSLSLERLEVLVRRAATS